MAFRQSMVQLGLLRHVGDMLSTHLSFFAPQCCAVHTLTHQARPDQATSRVVAAALHTLTEPVLCCTASGGERWRRLGIQTMQTYVLTSTYGG